MYIERERERQRERERERERDLLANIRLLLLTVKYVHSLQNSVGHLETRKFMIRNKKNYALPRPGKPEAYSKKYSTFQTGYGHSYISTYARHK